MPQNGPRDKKNVELLIQALACGATIENAARQAGVAIRTATRRMSEPDFRRQLSKVRGEMMGRATGMLTAASLESVKTLLDLQKSSPPTVRLGAARAVIELASKLREMVDLQVDIDELETKVQQLQAASDSSFDRIPLR